MIKRIILENFMAHKHTELELSPGLNVLVGPNNCGKSAIVEAMRCLAFNPIPKNVIRHGAKEAKVSVILEDDTVIEWVRKKDNPLYNIRKPGEEPQKYAKFGRNTPEDVLKLLRLNMIVLEGEKKIDVHIGNQREPIFLLNEPGTVAAAFFAASTEAAHLLSMQQALKNKVQKARQEEKIHNERQMDTLSRLDGFSCLPDMRLDLEKAAALLDAAEIITAQIPVITELISRIRDLGHDARLNSSRLEILNSALAPPVIESTAHLGTLVAELSLLLKRKNRTALKLNALTSLRTSPGLGDCRSLDALILELNEVKSSLRIEAEKNDGLSRLTPPPVLYATHSLDSALRNIRKLGRDYQRLDAVKNALEPLSPPPGIERVTRLAGLIPGLREACKSSSAAETRLEAMDGLAEPPRLHKTRDLILLVRNLTNLNTSINTSINRCAVLSEIIIPPRTDTLVPLAETIAALREVRGRISAAQEEAKGAEAELELFRTGLQARLAEIGSCPLCGSSLDQAHFFTHGIGNRG